MRKQILILIAVAIIAASAYVNYQSCSYPVSLKPNKTKKGSAQKKVYPKSCKIQGLLFESPMGMKDEQQSSRTKSKGDDQNQEKIQKLKKSKKDKEMAAKKKLEEERKRIAKQEKIKLKIRQKMRKQQEKAARQQRVIKRMLKKQLKKEITKERQQLALQLKQKSKLIQIQTIPSPVQTNSNQTVPFLLQNQTIIESVNIKLQIDETVNKRVENQIKSFPQIKKDESQVLTSSEITTEQSAQIDNSSKINVEQQPLGLNGSEVLLQQEVLEQEQPL